MKFRIKSAILLKKDLIVNLFKMKKGLRGKLKSYEEKISSNFHDNKIPIEGLVDSVFRTAKNYYPQVFLEEYNYVLKEENMPKYIKTTLEK